MNTCKECLKAQADISSIKYVQFEDTDIMIVACQKHLNMMEHGYIFMLYETLDELRENSKK